MVKDITTNSTEFLTAADYVKKVAQPPSDEELLTLYGLYKQAVLGDNNTNKPSVLNLKGRKKWEAWESNRGKLRMKSEIEYINQVNTILKNYGIKK